MRPFHHLSRRASGVVGLGLVALIAAALLVWKRDDVMRALLYHRPISFNASFHEAVASADRVVIRRGGFDCCRAVGNDEILATVSGIQEVRQFRARFEFEPEWVTNVWEFGGCLCSGYPGIDWYRSGRRVALTSVQHGENVRWKGFSTARILGVKVGYGDAPLTSASRGWLNEWLAEHGASETQLDQERNEAVGESLEAPDAPPPDVTP
jgi:hypothetical protein